MRELCEGSGRMGHLVQQLVGGVQGESVHQQRSRLPGRSAARTHWIVLDHVDHDRSVGDGLPMRLQSDAAAHGQQPSDCDCRHHIKELRTIITCTHRVDRSARRRRARERIYKSVSGI